MLNTVSAREIQRRYKSIFAQVARSKKPTLVVSNNKLLGAIVSLGDLEVIRLERTREEAVREYTENKTKSIRTEKELKDYLRGLKTDLDNGNQN